MAAIALQPGTPVSTPVAWQSWNQLYTMTSATTSTAVIPASATWTSWNQQYATGALGVTFTSASNTTSANIISDHNWYSWNLSYQETADQRAAREAREARAAAEWEAGRPAREAADAERRLVAARQQEERARATDRALELLESCLTLDQWRSYKEQGYFEVISSRGRRWRIRKESQAGNVDLMAAEGDVREASFCVHPPDSLPHPDAHLAQMLQLETDEDALLAVANVVHLRPGLTREQLRAA